MLILKTVLFFGVLIAFGCVMFFGLKSKTEKPKVIYNRRI